MNYYTAFHYTTTSSSTFTSYYNMYTPAIKTNEQEEFTKRLKIARARINIKKYS